MRTRSPLCLIINGLDFLANVKIGESDAYLIFAGCMM